MFGVKNCIKMSLNSRPNIPRTMGEVEKKETGSGTKERIISTNARFLCCKAPVRENRVNLRCTENVRE